MLAKSDVNAIRLESLSIALEQTFCKIMDFLGDRFLRSNMTLKGPAICRPAAGDLENVLE